MAGPDRGGAARRPAPSWDRLLTIVLLVVGLWNVTTTVAQARDLPAFIGEMFAAQGLTGGYTSTDVGNAAGLFVIGANVLSLVLAIGFAVPRLRVGRTAFWIPLVAGVVAVVVTLALVLSAMIADPAFLAYVQQQS